MGVVVSELLVILALTILNGFFSASEIAVLGVRTTRLERLAAEGHGSARVALGLRRDLERFLATVQVGITVLGATAGAFGGAVLEAPITTALARLGLGGAADRVAFALVVVLVSALSVVVGELVPKSLALRHAERIALVMARPLELLSQLARPVVWLLTAASNLLLRPFQDATTFTEARLSPEELQQLVDEATKAGTVDGETGEIASRAIDLGTLEAYAFMVPRQDIAWLRPDTDDAEAKSVLRSAPHARYPVRDGADRPLGYVLAHDVYAQLLDGGLDTKSLLRPIPTFAERARAVDVLRALQRARSEIGLILDARGAPAGLVSIETLAEQLFGEIVAEREHVTP